MCVSSQVCYCRSVRSPILLWLNLAESNPTVSLSGDNIYGSTVSACPQHPHPCMDSPALTIRESRIICLSLSESFSPHCLSFFSPLSVSVEGHLKEVIPIPLCFLSLLSEGLCGQRWSPSTDQQSKSQRSNGEAEENSSTYEIAAFYPPGVNSKISAPL